jgi:hypothetical protein
MGTSSVIGYTEYQPHGENLTFTRNFPADTESSEVLFADAIRVHDHLSGVVRPSGHDLWFTCAIGGTYINVDDPEPSEQYWEILRQDAKAPTDYPPVGPPTTTKRFPTLTSEALATTYRQALNTVACPSGFFVMFEKIAPLEIATRVVDTNESAGGGVFPVTLWGDTLALTTTIDSDGSTWLAPLPENSPFLPPVTFSIQFESILVLTLSVNWSRWLDKRTGEHELVQSALDSLLADDWQPQSSARNFTV